ncbi:MULTISPECIES: ribokinase [unclassified Streptomyces]|uniref:ribokinase n=1 Tax=unclassified Streptomyces TaxID=2593676 RepID=UPI002DD9EFD3|nr:MULTISPECIES: ribokinase [unclassified Streptomyces]WSF87312.1 ribokinase [Streptomyces sp. NBC_01744]WSC36446.1 ribokinase [Streptomyces sp. NBC_01763]WSC44544.1 ribokinase [Streptomyces sp. NBC_01762]WSC56474.1 ribokinase [Streptomyces sp. NBC_01761]WSD24131.1 ribokinase [Streptomyces sp. NBC_01751]
MTAIAVLGSTNMDLVAYVARAPERGETVTGREFRTIPGGKGANQAIAAARAGADVLMIGAVGDDAYGAQLRAELEHAGVETDLLHTAEGPSGTAHIVVDDTGGNAIVVIPGANGTVHTLGPGEMAAIAEADLLLLQLELPLSAVVEGARMAHAQGVRTILTPSPVQPLPDELFDTVDLLIPNEHEAAALSGKTEPHAAAEILLRHVPEVVITLGSKGCLYAARGGETVHFPAPEVTAVDTTGAGDTFVGALAVALGEGRAVPEALAWASTAAALCVQKPGASTSMPYRSEIDAA